MYWPNGVPRVYAVNGPGVRPIEVDDDAKDHEEDRQEAGNPARRTTDERSQNAGAGEDDWADEAIIGLCVSRSGHLFATMTKSSIAIWQTKVCVSFLFFPPSFYMAPPSSSFNLVLLLSVNFNLPKIQPTAVVAAVKRSRLSLKNYGPNVDILLRSDSAIIVVQTQNGYLITYSIATGPNSQVYQQRFPHSLPHHHQTSSRLAADDSHGIREVSLRFRVAIKVDAGISKALALDNELMVATIKPAAIQLIRWTPDSSGNQTSTELLSHMSWISKKSTIVEMVYDRAMNLLLWITNDGRTYAVQYGMDESHGSGSPRLFFKGHTFHTPENDSQRALQVAINARFSLLAVSCVDGEVFIYAAKDYMGNIILSHKLQLPTSAGTMGQVSFLNYSPDGYCLFAGYQHGWTTWSVFGKPGGTSFTTDRSLSQANGEAWLTGTSMGAWIGGGSDILLISHEDKRIWVLETARSALTGCFSSANLARALLQTGTEIILYRGHDLPDLTTISGKDSLWHHVQYPPSYLHAQWPIRACCISQDGRYVAIAGRRGMAHYSVYSNRWKTFDEPKAENSFAVQGGMCWYGHILIAAVECNASYEVRYVSFVCVLDLWTKNKK